MQVTRYSLQLLRLHKALNNHGVRKMDSFDWESTALTLLEKNLNGHSLNSDALKELFPPEILNELDIRDNGSEVEDIDAALYDH